MFGFNLAQDPYKMVLFNVLSSIILGSAIFIYKYVYPKRNINLLILLIVISILPVLSNFRPGTYESGDLSLHSMEAIYFYKILGQGDLFPKWAGEMNATYGYPSFLFTYPLPFYFITIFHFFGNSFIASTKLILALSYITSGIFIYIWLTKELGTRSAFIGGLFYLFAPYHLVDMHFRADIGEVLAFVFIPLSLLAANSFIETRKVRWFILEIISFSALILSHPAISIIGVPVLISYIALIIFKKDKKIKLFYSQIVAVSAAVFLTAFYWLPVIYNLRFTHQSLFSKNLTFVEINELFYSPWKFGLLFQGPKGELAFLLGYAHLIVITLAIFLLITKRIEGFKKNLLLLSLFLTILFSFMMLEISKPLWEITPLINNFQFTYRLLGITMLSMAIIAAITTTYINSTKFIYLISFLVIFTTILNWGNRKSVPEVTDYILEQQLPNTATNGSAIYQAITIWSDPNRPFASSIPKKNIEILKGNGEIIALERKNTYHSYIINAYSELIVKENTLYFPGWKVYINGKSKNIDILHSSSPSGIISFTVPKGMHKVEVMFLDTYAETLGKIISISILLLTIIVTTVNNFWKFLYK